MAKTGNKRTRVGFISPPTYFDISSTEFLRAAPEDIDVTQVALAGYWGCWYSKRHLLSWLGRRH